MSFWQDSFLFNPVGAHTQNSSLSSAVTLTVPDTANKILIQATGQNVRMTLDGTAPTTSKGFVITAGDPAVIMPVGPSTTIKLIEEAASAVVEYQFGQ